jgi:hypothetical protein
MLARASAWPLAKRTVQYTSSRGRAIGTMSREEMQDLFVAENREQFSAAERSKSDEEDWRARTSFPAANAVEDGADRRLHPYRKRMDGRWYAGAPGRDCNASMVTRITGTITNAWSDGENDGISFQIDRRKTEC